MATTDPDATEPAMAADVPLRNDGGGFCCAAKKYLSHKNAFINSLEIIPRVVICRKPMRLRESYEQTITIKNCGSYPRYLKFYTDSEKDTTLKVTEYYRNNYLGPDEVVEIEIFISPREKVNINRRRHIYVESEHPTLKLEIPIIVAVKNAPPSIPDVLIFPRSLMKTFASYEMIIYNPTTASISVLIKSLLPNLEITLSSKSAPKKDYIKVLFKFYVKDFKNMSDVLKIKFDTSSYVSIPIEHKPIFSALFISCSHIEFEPLAFERETKKDFKICNETSQPLSFNINFLTETTESVKHYSVDGDNRETEDEIELIEENSVLSWELEKNPTATSVDSSQSVKCKIPRDKYDVTAYRHFSLPNTQGIIEPNSSTIVSVIFHPLFNDETNIDDDLQPPFVMRTKIFVNNLEEDSLKGQFITIVGLIKGPEIEFSPKTIDVRKIYVGEEHCFLIKALNVDGLVKAKVYFADYAGKNVAAVTITPDDGFYLEPCQHGTFHLRIFAILVGKFTVKLKFKVHNGALYNIVVKGISQMVRLRTFPDILEFGSIPVAVPQKRYVLIMNPLNVPIIFQCSVAQDGEETPLVLNIRDVDDYLPITVKDPIKQLEGLRENFYIEDCPPVEINSRETSEISFRSVQEDNSSYSASFEESILQPMPDFAVEVVANIRKKKFLEKSEIEKRILLEAMDTLMATKYFESLSKYNNYAYMDWNALPSDPKEIYCDNEIIHLKPNTGKTITVLLIPNTVGYFNRAIDIRVCPINTYTPDEDFKTQNLIKSETMISKLWIEYDCRIPDIKWLDIISFDDRTVYAGEEYTFEIEFSNFSNVGGFIYFDVLPSSADGCMYLVNNIWKFYIASNSDENAFCSVIFAKTGEVELMGIIKYVGKTLGMPFHITATVLPERIRVTPTTLFIRQNVLDYSKVHFFIENITPTRTWLTASLKNEQHQCIEPLGGILNPHGQGMYVTLHSKFYDPETYKNILSINLHFGTKVEIPVTFLIEGMPIYFDPNIKDGFDGGIILTNSKENFDDKKPNFSKLIKVTNRGERCYQLLISKLKSSLKQCGVETVMSRIIVTPKTLILEPGDEKFIHITANAFEDTKVYNEFRVQIVDQTNRQRFQNIRFVVTATFIQPEINWNRRFICFNYNRTHEFKEQDMTATVQLKNIADVEIELVNIKVMGPFKIQEGCKIGGCKKEGYVKELDFKINGLERKDFRILLIKSSLKNKYCTYMEGRIYCTANERLQQCVSLRVNINNPELKISQPELVLFTQYSEKDIDVKITNVGCLEAQYKWKKLNEITEFIGEYDDAYEFAHEILSDLFRMLDISEEDSDWEDIDRPNMTLRYQRMVCKLKRLEDPIGVDFILDEIINNLDLEHKRYLVNLDETFEENTAMDCNETSSTRCYVKKTIYTILNLLKLEDSFDVLSQVSSDDCMKERTVYFYEKYGTLKEKNIEKCLLHLPGVRPGYATTASFLLEIVGANTQKFNITLVNLENTIELSRDNIYLGIKPWYELYKTNVRIRNVTQYAINIYIEEIQESKKKNRIANGYVWITSNRCFNIPTSFSKVVKAEGIMGFSDEFTQDIRVIVNDAEKTQIRLRGQGVMPMLSMTSKLARGDKDPLEVIDEYELLKRIYHFEVFKGITTDLGELLDNEEEGVKEASSIFDISQTSHGSESSITNKASERRFYKLIKTYVLVNHNEELPNATVLEQLLETEKFLKRLRENADTCLLLHLVYKEYVKMLKCYDERMPVNLKYFTTQPLPFEVDEFILNMNEIKLGQFRRFEIKLQFFGPGKLIAAARTAVKIPGLTVDFEVSKNDDKDFIYYSASEDKAPDFFQKRYRNLYEREIDLEVNPKLKHAHSFDINSKQGHQREIFIKDRKNIQNYYNSLNKSVYLEHKHHFVLCKIFSNSKHNFSGTNLSLILLMKPEGQFYDDGQLLEDYLYIDLHMGPTLPILLRGMISS